MCSINGLIHFNTNHSNRKNPAYVVTLNGQNSKFLLRIGFANAHPSKLNFENKKEKNNL